MLLIPCPWCGNRPENEFRYGGQATCPAAGRSGLGGRCSLGGLSVSARQSEGTPYRAVASPAWLRAILQLRARYGNRSHRDDLQAGRGSPMTRPPSSLDRKLNVSRRQHDPAVSLRGRWPDRSRAHASFHLRRPFISRLRRRYTGIRVAGERRSSGRAIVQISSSARHPVRRVRGTQRTGHDRSRRRAHHAEPASDSG